MLTYLYAHVDIRLRISQLRCGSLHLDTDVQSQPVSDANIFETVRASEKMSAAILIEIVIRPPKYITANVVLGDIYLNFQGHTFEMLTSRKQR